MLSEIIKNLKTETIVANAAAHCKYGVFDLWSDWRPSYTNKRAGSCAGHVNY